MLDTNSDPNLISDQNTTNFDQSFSEDELFPSTIDPTSSSMLPTDYDTIGNDLTQTSQFGSTTESLESDNLTVKAANQDTLTGNDDNQPLAGEADWLPSKMDQPFELLADSNRDGLVDDRDRQDKTVWNDDRGAIMLPNLDDDGGKVKEFNLDNSDPEADTKLEKLNDANDNVVNGTEDEQDLAPLKITPWKDAPADTSVKVSVDAKSSPYIRLFVKRDGEYQALDDGNALTVSELQQGAELAVEAKDVVRDSSVWDGFVDLTLEAKTGEQTYSDRVKMRVSPLLFKNNLMPVQNLYISDQPETQMNQEFITQSATQLGIDPSSIDVEKFTQNFSNGAQQFRQDIQTALQSGNPNTQISNLNVEQEVYVQDFFEPAYVSMPKADG
ncbi:MAG: protein-arginine deiminase family protein, partial [Waterburya sp.]